MLRKVIVLKLFSMQNIHYQKNRLTELSGFNSLFSTHKQSHRFWKLYIKAKKVLGLRNEIWKLRLRRLKPFLWILKFEILRVKFDKQERKKLPPTQWWKKVCFRRYANREPFFFSPRHQLNSYIYKLNLLIKNKIS